RAAQVLVDLEQRTGDAVPDRRRLRRHAAAADVHRDVEASLDLGDLERLVDDHARRLAPEVVLERTIVHHDAPLARTQPDLGDRALALAGGLKDLTLLCHGVVQSCAGTGVACCAPCGCSAPGYTFSFVISRRERRFFGSMPCTAPRTSRSGFSSSRRPAVVARRPPGYSVWR